METNIQEIWKDIPGYNGKYQISSLGKVKSPNKILKTSIDRIGYVNIRIGSKKNNDKKSFRVHRLVASGFIPNPENYPAV